MSKPTLPPRMIKDRPNSEYFNAIYKILDIPAKIEKGIMMISAQAWLIESVLDITPRTMPGDDYNMVCDRFEKALREWEFIE